MSTAAKNKEFEARLLDAAKSVLRDNVDPQHYTDVTLGEMFRGENEPYADADGNEYTHEIGSYYTADKTPHVVTL